MKFKLVIAYDGTRYEGWQVQKIGTGVQQIVETALAKSPPDDEAPKPGTAGTGMGTILLRLTFMLPPYRNRSMERAIMSLTAEMAATFAW